MSDEQVRFPTAPALPELKVAEPGADGTVHTHHQGDPQQETDAAHHEAQRLKEEPAGTTEAVRISEQPRPQEQAAALTPGRLNS